jgi:UDP-glucose 4-epimerase
MDWISRPTGLSPIVNGNMDLRCEYSGKTVLVTGAAGFIGSHLTDALVDLGAQVRALDDLSDGVIGNLHESWDRTTFLEQSLVGPESLDNAVAGCDFVFHLAANASVPRSSADPAYDFRTNVVGTHRLMEAFRKAGAGRLIFTSSAGVYGEPVRPLMDEDHPLRPQSPYGGSKLSGEFLLAAYGRCYGFDQRRVRIFNTFGPRQRRYVMFDLLEKLRRDWRRLEILGTGEQVRTYNYITDTVTALLLVGAHPEAQGQVYNIGGESSISIKELADLLIQVLGIERPQISYTGESWPGDIAVLCGDVGRLRGLGFRALTSLEEGLRQYVQWYRQEYSPSW